jgi:hypothetical protein
MLHSQKTKTKQTFVWPDDLSAEDVSSMRRIAAIIDDTPIAGGRGGPLSSYLLNSFFTGSRVNKYIINEQ